MMRRTIFKAFLIGSSIEGASAGAFASGGFGPCGPTNVFGFIGFLTHLFPGFLVGVMLHSAGMPDAPAIVVMVIVQGCFWSLIALAGLYLFKAR
jgi:hypothetical protein